MDAVEKATATQLSNIEKKTGKTLAELGEALRASGLTKHGELRDFAKTAFGLGHGDANTLVHTASAKPKAAPEAEPDDIYVGPKAHMRPIHDALLQRIVTFGEFEIAQKLQCEIRSTI